MYWIDSEGRDLSALVLRDFVNWQDYELIYEGQKADVSAFSQHPTEYYPLTVIEEYRRPERTILHESVRADYAYLE